MAVKTSFKNPYQTNTGINPATGLPWGYYGQQGYTGEYVSPGSVPKPPGGGAGPVPLPKPRQQNPYMDLINQLRGQQRADISAEGVGDAASRDAALRRLLISYGEAPDLQGLSGDSTGFLQGVLDPHTRELIAANTAEGTSVSARIKHAHEIAQRDLPENLAGAGRLHSGETGYQLGEEALQNKQTVFDTLNELAGNVEGTVGGWAANERARQRAMADLDMQSAWDQFNNWGDIQYDEPGSTDQAPGTTAAVNSNVPLSKQAWMRLHPGGNYQNYLQAWRRHQAQARPDYGQQALYGPGGYQAS